MRSKEVLKLLGISRATLTSYVEKGIIKVKERPFGRYDYDRESVEALIDPAYKSLNSDKVIAGANKLNGSEGVTIDRQNDALRIQKICLDNWYDVSIQDCILIWERHSFINSVEWMDLPKSDHEIWDIMEDEIE